MVRDYKFDSYEYALILTIDDCSLLFRSTFILYFHKN